LLLFLKVQLFWSQAITDKLEAVAKFEEKVKKIENFVNGLTEFDKSLKGIDNWMTTADQQLKDIKETSGEMTPEDRVSYTMELQEDIAAKVKIIQELIDKENGLLPQGNDHKRRFSFCFHKKRVLLNLS